MTTFPELHDVNVYDPIVGRAPPATSIVVLRCDACSKLFHRARLDVSRMVREAERMGDDRARVFCGTQCGRLHHRTRMRP